MTRSILAALILSGCASGQESGPPARPNILIAIADDWGPDHAGAYGCRWVKTPAFDRVAREGVLFTRAYTPNAKCAPSRAIFLTGRHSWQLEEAANHWCVFPPKFKTWPEALRDRGYVAGVTGKGWGPGVAKTADGQPRAMIGRAFNARTLTPPTSGIGRNNYAANFDDFLAGAPKGQPWLFWYGAVEPHRGYEPGSGEAAGKRPADIDRVPAYWPDHLTTRRDLLDYALEIEHFDRHLGRMLEAIERRGELDNTIVLVTSDHGMPFPRVKGQAYDASNRVPLAIRWPARVASPGRAVQDYVSFVDVAATVLESAGISWSESGLSASPGRSLSDVLRSERANPARDHVLVGKERHDVGRPGDVGYPIRGIVKGDWLFLRNYEPGRWPACNPETGYLNCDGGATKTFILEAHRRDPADPHWALCFGKRPAEELYDLTTDRDCVRNLAGDPAHAQRRFAMAAAMTAELSAQDDPRHAGQGRIFDNYPYADTACRGFYERFMAGEKVRAGWVNPGDFEK